MEGHTGKVGLGTQEPYVGPRTQNSPPGTRDLEPIGRTRDLYLGLYTWGPMYGTHSSAI